MHSTINYHLAKAQIAEFHRRAERNRAARTAVQASRARTEPSHDPTAADIPAGLASRQSA